MLLSQRLLWYSDEYFILFVYVRYHSYPSSINFDKTRKPSKQRRSSGVMERTRWYPLFVSRCPIVVHWLEGFGWYSSTWQAKMIKYRQTLASPPIKPCQDKLAFTYSPQTCGKSHYNRRLASSCLLQSRHEHRPMALAGWQGKSILMLHGWGSTQKKGCRHR